MGILITGPCRSEQKPCSDRDLGPSAKISNTVGCCGLKVSPEGTYCEFLEVRKSQSHKGLFLWTLVVDSSGYSVVIIWLFRGYLVVILIGWL